jgi:hypothetical protein
VTPLNGPAADGDTWRLEQFSKAYVQAVAAGADCSVSSPGIDIDSVDLILKRKTFATARRSPQLDIQVKATAAQCIGAASVSFPVRIKNYDELRDSNYAVPRILVVVVVPEQIQDWMEHDESRLALKRCGYWLSLRGFPASENEYTVTVSIPRSQAFDVQGLDQIFLRLADGGYP